MKNILHIYNCSQPHTQSRVLKMMETQSKIFKERVYFICKSGLRNKVTKQKKNIFIEIKINNYKFILAKFKEFIYWFYKIYQFTKKRKISIICCHSLICLPICAFLKIINLTTILIYEPHEFETEVYNANVLRRVISKFIERFLIKYCNYFIFVTSDLKKIYRKKYNIRKKNCIHISNITTYSNKQTRGNTSLKKKIGINEDDLLFVYIGILHESRFIKEILSFFSNHPEKNIVFFGHGEIDYLVDEYSRNFKNIFLKPMVPLRDISQTLYGADVGFSLLKKNLNHKFTSSNKIFQYLSAKVPVVASTNLEMKKIIKNFNCGWVIERPEKLYSKLSKINKKQIIDKKKKINQIFGTYNWKNEKIKLENFYKNINKIYFKSKKVI